jgi:thermostable 8-oxoguanine DNA glycosylase
MKRLFSSKNEIISLLERADNKDITRKLTLSMQKLKETRNPFYLQINELQDILEWKLRGQIGRQLIRRNTNTNDNIIIITKAAFSVTHKDIDIETSLRLQILTSLSGVAVPVASAILTLCFPSHYSVIDFRNWRQIYGNLPKKTTPSIKDYTDYLKIIRAMATEFEVTPQEIDIAIWQRDIENN